MSLCLEVPPPPHVPTHSPPAESIHAVFLHYAITESGMDMGIVNAKEMLSYDELDPGMKEVADKHP